MKVVSCFILISVFIYLGPVFGDPGEDFYGGWSNPYLKDTKRFYENYYTYHYPFLVNESGELVLYCEYGILIFKSCKPSFCAVNLTIYNGGHAKTTSSGDIIGLEAIYEDENGSQQFLLYLPKYSRTATLTSLSDKSKPSIIIDLSDTYIKALCDFGNVGYSIRSLFMSNGENIASKEEITDKKVVILQETKPLAAMPKKDIALESSRMKINDRITEINTILKERKEGKLVVGTILVATFGWASYDLFKNYHSISAERIFFDKVEFVLSSSGIFVFIISSLQDKKQQKKLKEELVILEQSLKSPAKDLEMGVKASNQETGKFDSNLIVAYHNLAVYYYRNKLYEKALEEWQIVYELNPNYPDVQKNLQLVKDLLAKDSPSTLGLQPTPRLQRLGKE